jgi:hypothetical protein
VLPDFGANINYDFLAEEPLFEIANQVPVQEAIQGEVTFAEDKHLRFVPDSDLYFFHVDLVLRAEGVVYLFEPIYIRFDETLSLLDADGSISLTAPKNTSVTSAAACESYSCDQYHLGWDFFPTKAFSIYGFRWSITPELIPGGELPEKLSVDTYLWGAGSILVVPEPNSAALTAILLAVANIFSHRVRTLMLASIRPHDGSV